MGSLNMNGGRDRNKLEMLSEMIRIRNIDIIFLQETHSDSENETDWGI